MKLLDIALKDIKRSFRSTFFLVFGFGVPLLATTLFYFAFGGIGSDGGADLAATKVQVVNQDQPGDAFGGFSAGQMLLDLLQSEEMGALVEVTEAADPAAARTAVDRQAAGVALIIPDGFTAAMAGQQEPSAIELYHDPTLTLGPSIVRGIISQFVDGFAGSQIARTVVREQLAAQGLEVNEATLTQISLRYGEWARALGETQEEGTNLLVDKRAPAGVDEEAGIQKRVLGMIMAGMMVFYAFFTGGASAMTILQEEEEGTLPRLFTTPTPKSTILAGKFVATFLNIAIQIVVLVVVSSLVFRIDWGNPLPIALATGGTVVVAASFGILVTSLLKNTKQTGFVYGGVYTILGMIGMIGVFTGNLSATLSGYTTASLFVPQGWGVFTWTVLLAGGGLGDILLPVGVMAVIGIACFAIGALNFRRRFD